MTHRSTNRRTKRRAPWAAYLWPGLAHLWVRGSWAGLVLAVGFTLLLHTVVLGTLVWPEWLPPRVVNGVGVTLGLLWMAALIETRGELRRLAAEQEAEKEKTDPNEAADSAADSAADPGGALETPPVEGDGPLDNLLVDAQRWYLRADWVKTERSLLQLLRKDGEDVEAQLLLATLWRRIGRPADARRRLRRLSRREAADPWREEIETELRLCEGHRAENPGPAADPLPGRPAGQADRPPPAATVQPSDDAQPQPPTTDRRAA